MEKKLCEHCGKPAKYAIEDLEENEPPYYLCKEHVDI